MVLLPQKWFQQSLLIMLIHMRQAVNSKQIAIGWR